MGLVATVFLLVVLEISARVAQTLVHDFTAQRSVSLGVGAGFILSPEFGWVRQPGFRGISDGGPRQFDMEGYLTIDSEKVGDSYTPKVLFIGGSNTLPYHMAPEDSFVEIADRLLPNAHAINLGVTAYSSYQGALVARKYVPRLKPKVAVVCFGWNDRRYVITPTEVDSATRFDSIYRTYGGYDTYFMKRVRDALGSYYTYRGMRWVLKKVGFVGVNRADKVQVRLDKVLPRVDKAAYKKNLSEIAAVCQGNGVKPIFILFPDNPVEARPLRAGIASLEKGDPKEAIRLLTKVIDQDGDLRELAIINLAMAYRVIGKLQEAENILNYQIISTNLDGWKPIYLDTEYNQVMREVAQEYGIELIDVVAVLEKTPLVFSDSCHLNENGHRIVGELVAERILRLLD